MTPFSAHPPSKFVWIRNDPRMGITLPISPATYSLGEERWYDIRPYIRFAQYDVVPPARYKEMDIFIKERVIFDYELLFVKSGHARVRIEDRLYEARPGDIFLFKPKQRHSIELTGNETFIQPHIHFDLIAQQNSPDVYVSFKSLDQMDDYEKTLFREDITDQFISPFPSFIRIQNTYLIEQYIFDIIQKYESRQPFSQIILQGLFLQLWYYLLVEIQLDRKTLSSKKWILVDEIKRYLDQNTDRVITMDQLASQFYINKFYISRLFKQMYNISPIQYHTQRRIQQAVKLLYLTNLSITEIASRVGYNSIHRFSKVFKSILGVAPSVYRNTHQGGDFETPLPAGEAGPKEPDE